MHAPCTKIPAHQEAIETLAARAGARASAADADGDPTHDIADLKECGVLAVPVGSLPGANGDLLDGLRALGRESLSLGRLYEGHVNALQLVAAFGNEGQQAQATQDAGRGLLFGVWNTEQRDGVRMVPCGFGFQLLGRKIFASGAGFVERPLITARREDGSLQLVLLRLDGDHESRVDQSGWTPLGMKASASGQIDLEGFLVEPSALIGEPGDYHRQPWFSAGAIRFAAVQLGGAETLGALYRNHLIACGRDDDPFQKARVAQVAMALETGRLWLEGAAQPRPAEALVAYINLARSQIERACLDVMEATTRGIGVQALLRPHPFERVLRDLTTYLRQPAPDAALAQAGAYVLASEKPIGQLWTSC